MLTRDQLLAKRPAKVEKLDLPELGTVWIKVMSGTDRDGYEAGNFAMGPDGKPRLNLSNARARLAVRCLCDDQGLRLFGDADADGLGRALDGLTLDLIAEAAKRLNRLTKESEEDLGKNLQGALNGISGSGSPVISA